ncbi:beta-2-microglobulin [Phascolarctos cinereus]|uniref:Beta-2-microglobulin n=1 Tax=Phascolarctos cinereus TaxID=38626 RepID=A0A6P5M8Q9_PHACI|nr:beta-2-microglobulin [Phascolarctos cinereus]XP_020864884.1 beta-2-microglobulin [Phascolarctos cinereus]
MARIFLLALLGQLCFLPYLDAITSSPKVQVYSRHPPDSDKDNYVNCFVSGFHPPQISIDLLKNGQKIEKVEMSDLSFSNDWTFHRLVSAPFDPKSEHDYACKVSHSTLEAPKVVKWDPESN